MKKLYQLCAMFALLTGTLCAQTAIDSKIAGRAFARGMWDSLSFFGSYDIDNKEVFRHFGGQMDLNGRIVSLIVDDVVIVGEGDTPLPGLPYVANGNITNFWLQLDALKGEDQVAYGGVFVSRLRENQAVMVTLYPEWELGFFEYTLPSGAGQPSLVDDDGNQVGWYDHSLKGFRYNIDPLGGSFYAYVVINGRKVASFLVDPFETAQSSENNLVNVELAGGVIRVVLNQWGYSGVNATTDGQTEVDGTMRPAKTFLVESGGDYLEVSASNQDGAGLRMEVYDVGEGRYDLIHSSDFQPVDFNDDHNTRYLIPSGYSTVMVVFVETTRTTPRSFRAFFSQGKGGRG